MNNTDALAAQILQIIDSTNARGERIGYGAPSIQAAMHKIDGMTDAWEFLTGSIATDHNLLAAAARSEHQSN